MTHEQLIWQGLTALVTILTVVAAYLKTRQQRATEHAETTTKIDEVQTTVNGQTERLHSRIAQLEQELAAAGVAVPPSPAPST